MASLPKELWHWQYRSRDTVIVYDTSSREQGRSSRRKTKQGRCERMLPESARISMIGKEVPPPEIIYTKEGRLCISEIQAYVRLRGLLAEYSKRHWLLKRGVILLILHAYQNIRKKLKASFLPFCYVASYRAINSLSQEQIRRKRRFSNHVRSISLDICGDNELGLNHITQRCIKTNHYFLFH